MKNEHYYSVGIQGYNSLRQQVLTRLTNGKSQNWHISLLEVTKTRETVVVALWSQGFSENMLCVK